MAKKEWTKLIGGDNYDRIFSNTVDKEGSIYTTGITSIINGSDFDTFLIKHDANGEQLWTQSIRTDLNDTSNSVVVDPDGSFVYIAGVTKGNLEGRSIDGNGSPFLSKYTSGGLRLWTKFSKNSLWNWNDPQERWVSAATGSDGSVYLAGTTQLDINSPTLPTARDRVGNGRKDSRDMFIEKYSKDGTLIWSRNFGTTGSDNVSAITTSRDGSIYVAGRTWGHLDAFATFQDQDDSYIVKYSSDGVKLWEQISGLSNSADSITTLTTDANGFIYAAGYNGSGQAFISKYSSDGIKQWTHESKATFSGNFLSLLFSSIVVAKDGSIYGVGNTTGDLDGFKWQSEAEVFVMKLDSSGRKEWTEVIAGPQWQTGHSIAINNDESILIFGNANNEIDGKLVKGGGDGFAIKFSEKPTFAISSTSNVISEGMSLSASVATENIKTGTLLYYSLRGKGADANTSDFTSGQMEGSAAVGTDGKMQLSWLVANDLKTEGTEEFTLQIYSDPTRTKQVAATSFTVNDTSTTPKAVNDGVAAFKLELPEQSKNMLSVKRVSDDPDGNGEPSYTWYSSSNGNEWLSVGAGESYLLKDIDQGKQFKVEAAYRDSEGNQESVSTASLKIPFTNNGKATFGFLGNPNVGQMLSIVRTADDPDGNGKPVFTWKSQTDANSTQQTVSTDDNYLIAGSDLGKILRVEISYTDGEGNSETLLPLTIPVLKSSESAKEISITPSRAVVKEGETLITTINSTTIKAGTPIYWTLSGDGIDEQDFTRGLLRGMGTIDGNGNLSLSHAIKEDLVKEGAETISINVFSDIKRTQLLVKPVDVLIDDTSALTDADRRGLTFDFEVKDFKLGSEKSDKIIISDKEKSDSWALWGENGKDVLVGGAKDDFLIGGDGIDTLTGGKGSDTFVMTDFSQRDFDIITDFVAKDDVIGISKNIIDASEDDTIALITYKDIKNKSTAEKFFKTKKADKYILVDSAENIKKVNSKSFSKKILLSVDLTNKAVLYDADGAWGVGQDILCKFTGKMSQNSWSPDNFAFGFDVV